MSTQDDDDEVGYGKPPKHTQFKKGQSGNPKGRPKGAKGMKASLKRELETLVTVRDGGREKRVSKAEAVTKRLIANALKGDRAAISMVFALDHELFGQSDGSDGTGAACGSPEPVDYDILRDFLNSETTLVGTPEEETIEDWEIEDWENDNDDT